MKYILIILAFLSFSLTTYGASNCIAGTDCSGTQKAADEAIPSPDELSSGSPIHARGQLSDNCAPPELLDPTARTASYNGTTDFQPAISNGGDENSN